MLELKNVRRGRIKEYADKYKSAKYFEGKSVWDVVKEQGINFSMGMWRGLAAPKGTPQDVIQKLNESFKKAMDDPEFQARAKEMSVILSYLGPKDFGALMAKDDEFFGKLIKELLATSLVVLLDEVAGVSTLPHERFTDFLFHRTKQRLRFRVYLYPCFHIGPP